MLCLADYYTQLNEAYAYSVFLRYDWLVDSGIDVSGMEIEDVGNGLYVSAKGMPLEQLEAYLDYVVNGDPDGNGDADTVGYLKEYHPLLSAFGLINGINMAADGSAVPWYAHENIKDMLLWMQGAYANGLMYPEFFTIEWGADWELLTNGKAGLHTTGAPSYLSEWADSRPPRTWLNADIPTLMLPGFADENGNTITSRAASTGGQNLLFVEKEVTDEQVVAFLRFAEYAFFGNGDDAQRAPLKYGEEGVDFEFDAETGFPVFLLPDEERLAHGSGFYVGQIQRGQTWLWENMVPGSWYESAAGYILNGVWDDMRVYDYKNDVLTETGANSISAEYLTDWQEAYKSYFMKVILGEKNLDSDWDAYMEDLNDLDFDRYLEELNRLKPLTEVLDSIG